MVTSRTPLTVPEIGLGCVAIGLATGWLEVGALYLRGATRVGTGLGPHALWMTPVSTLAWFLALAAVLVALRRPLRADAGIVAGAGAVLGALDLILVWSRLHWAATLLLALGVGVAAARLVRRFERPARAAARRAAPVLAVLVAVAGVGVAVAARRAERAALAQLPAPRAGLPNVLLLVLDTVRASETTLFDTSLATTPALARRAREGMVFERAFSTAPWTLPSHGSMFTGTWAHEQSSGWSRPLDDRHSSVVEAFRDAGYATAGFVANLVYGPREHGLARGFIRYEDYPVSAGELFVSSALGRKVQSWPWVRRAVGFHDVPGRKRADRVARAFLQWQASVGNRPFFAFVNLFDAHEPYLPPEEIERRFVAAPSPRRHNYYYRDHDVGPLASAPRSAEEHARELAAYRGSIAVLDLAVDSVLDALARRGALDRTVVIVTSDHGEHFGERGHTGHATSVLSQVLHVPLVIRFPETVPAGRFAGPVTLRDLAATMLDLAGLEPGGVPGRSLARWWSGDSTTLSEPVMLASLELSRRRVYRSVLMGRHHFVDQPDWQGLFDIAADPREEHDLSGQPDSEALVARATALLDSLHPRVEASP